MAETIRDVLIKFRVDAPRINTVGGPGVGGVGMAGGGAASLLPGSQPAISSEDIERLRQSLDRLSNTISILQFSLMGRSFGSGAGLVGAGLQAARFAGGKIMAGVGVIGGVLASPFAVAAGATTLAVGAGGAFLNTLTDESLEAGPSFLSLPQRAFFGAIQKTRETQEFAFQLQSRFAERVSIDARATEEARRDAFGITGPRTEEEIARDFRRRRGARIAGLEQGLRQGALDVFRENIRDQTRLSQIRGGLTAESQLGAAQQQLRVNRARFGAEERDLQQLVTGQGPVAAGVSEGLRFTGLEDLIRRGNEIQQQILAVDQAQLSLARSQIARAEDIAGGLGQFSPAVQQRVFEIAGQARGGQDIGPGGRLLLRRIGVTLPQDVAQALSAAGLQRFRQQPGADAFLGAGFRAAADQTAARGIEATVKAIEDFSTAVDGATKRLNELTEPVGEKVEGFREELEGLQDVRDNLRTIQATQAAGK